MGRWKTSSISKEPTLCLQKDLKGRAGCYWLSNRREIHS